MEGLFGGTTSSSSSTPLRSACRTGTSSTLLGTARLPDSTTHPAARLQTRWIRILRWEKKKKSMKRSPTRPRGMRQEGLFRVKTAVLMRESHRLNTRTVAAGSRAVRGTESCVRVSECVCVCARARYGVGRVVPTECSHTRRYSHPISSHLRAVRSSGGAAAIYSTEEAVGRVLLLVAPITSPL